MKSKIKNTLRVICSVSLLIFLMFYIDIQKIENFTPNIISPAILTALTAAIAQIVLTSWRWRYLLKVIGIIQPLRFIIRTNVVGIISNIILINVIGGLAVRVGMLAQKGVEIHSVLSTSVLERLVIIIVLGIMSLGGIIYLGLGFHIHGSIAFRVIVGSVILAAVALMIANYTIPLFDQRLLWVKAQLLSTWMEIRAQTLNYRAMATTFVLTVVSQLLLIVVGVAVAYATDSTIPLMKCAMILPLVSLFSSLPISIGGLGLREASAVVLLGALGIPSEQALMISVLISLVTLIAACLSFGLDMLYELRLRVQLRSGTGNIP